MTPKQQVLREFPNACMGQRPNSNPRRYAVMQSAISWGEPVGADGLSPREAWAKAAANLKNWRALRRRISPHGG